MNPLQRASIVTIGIILSFVFFILILIGLATDTLSIYTAIPLTILINLILWAIGPTISDLIYKWFYKVKFFTKEEFAASYPQLHQFIDSVCQKYHFQFPKMGLINDRNPTAFTYGATRNNARIIFTEGITHYLSPDEIKAVLAHELGHIYHCDFIIMTIAITLIQILYELYFSLTRSRGKSSDDKKSGKLAIIGLASYIFYLIGSYLVLYLSRVREYYADSFAASVTSSPHSLIQALVKIAYGIVQAEDTTGSKRLLESTRSLGILDVKNAGFVGSLVFVSANPDTVAEVMAFDNVSPWAMVLEFSSTHPLTGKRIQALETIAEKLGQTKLIDFDKAYQKMNIDRKKLYDGFIMGILIYFLPLILPVFGFLLLKIGGAILFFTIGSLIKLYYMLSEASAKPSSILAEMRNPYASPIKGNPVTFEGKITGRGVPGFVFSEDMMFQDDTGIIYLNYHSMLGFLGNLFFAIGKVKKLLGESVKTEGWFFRGICQSITLRKLYHEKETISSHPKLWAMISNLALLLVAFLLILGGI